MIVVVYIDYTNGRAKKKKDHTFVINPELFLMQNYDKLAKETWIEYEQTYTERIEYIGKVAIK